MYAGEMVSWMIWWQADDFDSVDIVGNYVNGCEDIRRAKAVKNCVRYILYSRTGFVCVVALLRKRKLSEA
jgi:hypothetical protein